MFDRVLDVPLEDILVQKTTSRNVEFISTKCYLRQSQKKQAQSVTKQAGQPCINLCGYLKFGQNMPQNKVNDVRTFNFLSLKKKNLVKLKNWGGFIFVLFLLWLLRSMFLFTGQFSIFCAGLKVKTIKTVLLIKGDELQQVQFNFFKQNDF